MPSSDGSARGSRREYPVGRAGRLAYQNGCTSIYSRPRSAEVKDCDGRRGGAYRRSRYPRDNSLYRYRVGHVVDGCGSRSRREKTRLEVEVEGLKAAAGDGRAARPGVDELGVGELTRWATVGRRLRASDVRTKNVMLDECHSEEEDSHASNEEKRRLVLIGYMHVYPQVNPDVLAGTAVPETAMVHVVVDGVVE